MLNVIRQWVIKTMMKNNTGVVRTLPKKDLIELNTQITAQRLMQNGVNPESLTNVNQVENVINQIDNPPKTNIDTGRNQSGITSTKSAKVFDMEGKEIPPGSQIMGGKEVKNTTGSLMSVPNKKGLAGMEYETDAAIKARLEAQNKEAAERFKTKQSETIDDMKEIEDPEDMAQGGRAGYMNGTLPMKKDGFLVSPDFSKMTPKEIELYKLQMEIMKKGFEKKPSPEGLEKLKIQQQIREQQRKDRGLPEEIQLMAQGGRAGFKSGLGKRFLELLKGKPKLKFDEKRFREGPISLEFLENIDKKDLAPFIRTRDTMGPGGYGMYDNFADMPAGLRAAELIKTIKTKDGGINYKAAELFLGKRLKGDESADELIQMLNRKEMRADGGRIGYKAGSIDKMRRLILKTIGAGTVGIGAAKSGIFSGFGKQAAKEVVKQSTSTPPAYFFELAGKIKTLGRMSDGPSERIKEFSMKAKDGKSELLLTEDIGTGEMQIKKIGKEGDDMITEVQTMDYTPGSAQADETTKGIPRDQYDEYTEYNSRIYKDEFNDPTIEDGIKVDEIIEEVKDQAPSIKKAGGGIARMLGE